MRPDEPERCCQGLDRGWLGFAGSVALTADERDFGGDECQSLKLDGFALRMHNIGRQKTARCSLPDAFDLDIGFVHAPTPANRAFMFAKDFFKQGKKPDRPAID